jgi:3'-phosphoadenosine 5'-phosphosulfate sulfotransferase (PAPS reductase)/FAD synthetase
MKTYLSLGAGVDTTAILLMPDIMRQIDFVMFADTGSENPETYSYLEKYIKPYLEKIRKPLFIVKGEENVKGVVKTNMEAAYLGWKIIPVRFLRHCTDKWKIKPMHRYLTEHYPGEMLKVVIGFAYDEIQRVNSTRWKDQEVWYPLIEKKMTRDDCVRYIISKGFPVPPKSGCFYCPFQRLDQWKELRFKHPDLWQRAIILEKNGSHYPQMTLSNFKKKGNPLTLEDVDKQLGKSLYDYEFDPAEEECSGACMT